MLSSRAGVKLALMLSADPAHSALEELIERRSRLPTWRPISDIEVRGISDELTLSCWLDVSQWQQSLVKPGDQLFDYHEAQTKLYLKAGGFHEYKELLARYSLTWPLPPAVDHRLALFHVALQEGVVLDGVQRGFVYNIGSKHLIYCSIPTHALVDMAKRYVSIEKAPLIISNADEAKEYLSTLAEKYFYHEAGHYVYTQLLSMPHRIVWERTVHEDPLLVGRVVEIQSDKHPTRAAIPVADEAFADTFSGLVCGDRFSNRLGSFPRTERLASLIP